jgi:ribosomal protein L40E
MTGSIVCRRCGTSNVAGDQFCGSCGAFLEWEGEPTEPGESAGPAPAPTPWPAPEPVEPPPPPPPPVGAVVCRSCGTANPSTRTFCQSCGTILDPKAASGGVTPGPTPPVAVPRPEPRGGLPGWLPIVVGAGLVIGVAAVVAATVLRPAAPTALASAFPSATFTPTLAPTATPIGSTDSGGPGASEGGSAAPSVQLTATGATASSVVGDREKFAPAMVIDGALDTSWQEGAEDEAGEWVEVTLAPSRLDYVVIYSGYQLSHDAWLGNLRPQNVVVSVNGSGHDGFVLADSEQPQRLDIADTAGATTVRIEIVSAFASESTAYPGSPFDDLAISEIRLFGEAGG